VGRRTSVPAGQTVSGPLMLYQGLSAFFPVALKDGLENRMSFFFHKNLPMDES
jgi:hypothetical protein